MSLILKEENLMLETSGNMKLSEAGRGRQFWLQQTNMPRKKGRICGRLGVVDAKASTLLESLLETQNFRPYPDLFNLNLLFDKILKQFLLNIKV